MNYNEWEQKFSENEIDGLDADGIYALAQKKLAEWLDTGCQHNIVNFSRRYCPLCWVELRKELGIK